MPYFSFNMSYGEGLEDVRVELPDIKAAWSQAVRTFGETLEDIDGQLGLPVEWVITVSDEAGYGLFELRCMSRRLGAGLSVI